MSWISPNIFEFTKYMLHKSTQYGIFQTCSYLYLVIEPPTEIFFKKNILKTFLFCTVACYANKKPTWCSSALFIVLTYVLLLCPPKLNCISIVRGSNIKLPRIIFCRSSSSVSRGLQVEEEDLIQFSNGQKAASASLANGTASTSVAQLKKELRERLQIDDDLDPELNSQEVRT